MTRPNVSPRSRRVVHRAADIRRATGSDIRRIREDAGVSLLALARASGVSVGHLWAIEAGATDASTEALVAIGESLGADLSVRLYPTTGPRIRDHLQARIGETLLQALHPRWRRLLEVAVYRPVRGVIDLVLHDPDRDELIATEIQSELRRVEQQLRWSNQKRDAIGSSDVWRALGTEPRVSSALVLRNTRHNRSVASALEATLESAFPASTGGAVAALTGDAAWPGPALLWVDLDAKGGRLLDRPPRGVRVGR